MMVADILLENVVGNGSVFAVLLPAIVYGAFTWIRLITIRFGRG